MTARKRPVAPFAEVASETERARVTWPAAGGEFRGPGGIAKFAREVLRVEPNAKQLEIFAAVERGRKIAIRGGRKSGKTAAIAMVALWYYACFPGAKVKIVAPTADLLRDALYMQIRQYWFASQEGAYPLDGEAHKQAFNGVRCDERFAFISGVAASDEGAVRGVSGAHVLYIFDEASDVPDDIFKAANGNLAAGGECRMIVCSNPTRAEGYFYDAFTKLPFERIHAPAVVGPPNTGLASQGWLDEMAEAWGVESYDYRVHVMGEFAAEEHGRIFGAQLVQGAFEAWSIDAHLNPGDLCVGIDVAGESGDGDESVFAVRRGMTICDLIPRRGLSPERHVTELEQILGQHRRGRELVRVMVDGNGPAGDRVWRALRDAEERLFLRVRRFRYSDGPRQPKIFGTMRDEIHVYAADWLRAGGALPTDEKLRGELAQPATFQDQRGKTKVTDKPTMIKKLGRSPDRLDAVCLAVWDAPLGIEHAQRAESMLGDDVPWGQMYGSGDASPYAAVRARQV